MWVRPNWRRRLRPIWWIDAEQPALVAAQLAALADPLHLPPGRTVPDTVRIVLDALRRQPRWLLIFDNAELRSNSPITDPAEPAIC